MDSLMYTSSFKSQPYILNLTRQDSCLLMALRTRSVRGIRSDFGDMFLDKTCPLPGCQEADSLSHVLVCTALQAAVQPSVQTDVQRPVHYGDVFSDCLETQSAAVERFKELIELRTKLASLSSQYKNQNQNPF